MNKKLILLYLLLATSATAVFGQWTVVHETEKMMIFGSRPGFEIEFANTDVKTVLDVWKDFSKKNFNVKIKKDKKSDQWIGEAGNAGFVSKDPFTVYAEFEEKGGSVVFTAWFDIGSGFLNSRTNPKEARETADALRTFYYDVRRAVIGEEIKEAQKKLDDQESALKKLQKENDSLRKSIDDYNAKIKKAEEDVKKNTKEQESTIVNIAAQKKAVEEIQTRLKNVENEKQ